MNNKELQVTSLSYRGYGISMFNNESIIDNLRKELTVQSNNQGYVLNQNANKFTVYMESSKKIYIPKHYGLKHYGLPHTNSISDGDDMSSEAIFCGVIRDNQIEPVNSYLKYAKDPQQMGGILELPPGWGKTVIALYLAATLHKKTLVVVHKDFLLKQWRERISQYIPKARIGIIKQSIYETENCDIVIASLQTLCLRNFDNKTFGMVIVDECHHMGAQVFSQSFHKLNFRYSLGLSATVTRTDGLTKVFKWFLGDIVYKGKRNKDEQKGLSVKMIEFENHEASYKGECLLFNGKPNVSKMINKICSFTQRTDMICDKINEIMTIEPNRNMLILSDRRQHLVDIHSTLCDRNSFSSTCMGFYVGGMKNDDLKTSETKRILLGTYNMVSEGFDLPKLDTLVMISPKSNVEQSIGRIQRKSMIDREFTPLVIDIVDNFSVFGNQAKKRHLFYKKSGFHIIGGKYFEKTKDSFNLNGKSLFMLES
jgi:hypothetical protein